MFLTNTQRILGLDQHQGPRWVTVDDPRKSMPDEVFRYLRGNVYYTREWRLAHGVNMLVRGEVSMSLWFDDMADVRTFPDGSIRAVNGTEHLLFVYQRFFSHMNFTDGDGNLHPYLQRIWSNDVDKAREAANGSRPASDYRPYQGNDREVPLDFIGDERRNESYSRRTVRKPEFAAFTPSTPDAGLNEVCRELEAKRFFETKK